MALVPKDTPFLVSRQQVLQLFLINLPQQFPGFVHFFNEFAIL